MDVVLLACGLVMEIRADLDHSLQSRGSQALCDESSQLMDKPTLTCVSAVISMATQEK